MFFCIASSKYLNMKSFFSVKVIFCVKQRKHFLLAALIKGWIKLKLFKNYLYIINQFLHILWYFSYDLSIVKCNLSVVIIVSMISIIFDNSTAFCAIQPEHAFKLLHENLFQTSVKFGWWNIFFGFIIF